MKTIRSNKFAILIVLTITMLNVNAQISIDKNDMPSPDNIFHLSTGINLDIIDYEETGENHIWDFSQLVPISQRVDTFVSQLNAPLFYLLFYGLSSNLAKKENINIPIPEFPISSAYTFFNNTNSYYGEVGDAVMLYGLPIPLKYNSPDILYQFPMEYGNTNNSYAEFGLGLENYGYLGKQISRNNTVDGWGKLTTPYGTFDALRLVSEVIEFDSIYIDSLNIGLPINRVYTEYSWLGKGMGVPLLKITSSFGGAIVTYLDSARIVPSSVDNNKLTTMNIVVYPNPASQIINFEIEHFSSSEIKLEIYNLSGQFVCGDTYYCNPSETCNKQINLSKFVLNKGNYNLRFTIDNKQFSKRIILY
ncbi:MAG: T9SS type A sorting domain-containing protein [Bacteroidetes bacterium]|nr:T9SS type A sorting domain-containing protein [Bacteroidota bacterium]